MHELVLAQDILKKIIDEAKSRGLKRIKHAKVMIGETLIHDQTELEELFISVSKDTIAEGINLEIKIAPLKAVCGKCGTEFDASFNNAGCSKCGSKDINIAQGNGIKIEELS